MTRRSTTQEKKDRDAWPITLRFRVPELGFHGLGRDNDPYEWTRLTLGLGEYTTTSLHIPAGDISCWHFRSMEDAQRFVERFPMLELFDGTTEMTYNSPYVMNGVRRYERPK
ncbi:hypothetical protein [Ketogulonicigenium vulgare]|uniref:hypothetical protein n=1 Tax=Ketogulonicigenium vulgare TaxID=92945 RepID=UPI0005C62EDC|nr:hypothetical protein [Ketogulonicigenium vulgare]ALJ81555.1 hypothetical protein KVH_10435 [Ketogulonicigenium vulgare]ANW34252.1 hypothetical protein KvSKV_10375 [Ketogulonicigenium vulgare]